jgi:hypothetical protein
LGKQLIKMTGVPQEAWQVWVVSPAPPDLNIVMRFKPGGKDIESVAGRSRV